MNSATTFPPRKAFTAGIPRIEYIAATSWFSSTLILASSTAPPRASISFSSRGPSIVQGAHQGAQKSTTTGSSLERSITSRSKVSLVTSIAVSSGLLERCMGNTVYN